MKFFCIIVVGGGNNSKVPENLNQCRFTFWTVVFGAADGEVEPFQFHIMGAQRHILK